MVVTLGQQYNIGEKPTVILYTFNRHAGTPEKQRKKQKQKKHSSNNILLHRLLRRSHYIETRTKRAHDVDIFNVIQKVQDTLIHLEVDEE